MRMKLLAVALLGLPAAAMADPTLECSLNNSTQVEINDCLGKVETDVDATVTEALGFAMDAAKGLDQATGRAEVVPALEAGQAAWTSFREAHCAYVGTTFGGGSGTGTAIHACRIELGRARVATLMSFAG